LFRCKASIPINDRATPDDLEEFRRCQMSYRGRAARWNDLSRGAEHWIQGPNAAAKTIGLNPLMSGARIDDEGLFLVQHRYWHDTLRRALAAESHFQRGGAGRCR
jgi:benzoate/toluate 1,2-dioxygenase subunit alpha